MDLSQIPTEELLRMRAEAAGAEGGGQPAPAAAGGADLSSIPTEELLRMRAEAAGEGATPEKAPSPYAAAVQQDIEKRPVSRMEQFARRFVGGATLGAEPYIEAGLNTIQGALRGGTGPQGEERFAAELERARARNAEAEKQAGVLGTVANVVGGLPSGGAVYTGALKALRTPLLATMATGAGTAATEAAGRGEEDVGAAATMGGLGGAALHGLASGVGAAFGQKLGTTTERALVKQESKNAYRAFENSPVKISTPGIAALRQDIVGDIGKMFDPTMHPKVAAFLNKLERVGGGRAVPSMPGVPANQSRAVLDTQEYQNLMKGAKDIIKKSEPGTTEQMLGNTILSKMNDFIENLPNNPTFFHGTPQQAAEAVGHLNRANELYARASKAKDLAQLAKKAELRTASTYGGGNVGNVTRQDLRRLLEKRTDRPKGGAPWTKQEAEAIESRIKGGTAENFLRMLGKASPTSGGLSSLINLGLASHTGGMSLPLSGAAILAKLLEGHIAGKKFGELEQFILQGRNPLRQTLAGRAAQGVTPYLGVVPGLLAGQVPQ